MKKLVVNSERFGYSHDFNRAVLDGCNNGFLKNARIIVNGEAYDSAINDIFPECPNLSIGININLTRGKSLTKCNYITDSNGNFSKNFYKLIKLCNNDIILNEIKNEIIAQVNQIPEIIKITNISSVDSIHSIPAIFQILCDIAQKRKIKYIISHSEKIILPPTFKYLLNFKILSNYIKTLILNYYTKLNKETAKNYDLSTNDYFIGNLYSGIQDESLIEHILHNYTDFDNSIIELSLMPCSYIRDFNNSYSKEFKLTQNRIFEDTLNRMGFDIINYKN